jgi:hypothetical protein
VQCTVRHFLLMHFFATPRHSSVNPRQTRAHHSVCSRVLCRRLVRAYFACAPEHTRRQQRSRVGTHLHVVFSSVHTEHSAWAAHDEQHSATVDPSVTEMTQLLLLSVELLHAVVLQHHAAMVGGRCEHHFAALCVCWAVTAIWPKWREDAPISAFGRPTLLCVCVGASLDRCLTVQARHCIGTRSWLPWQCRAAA